MKCQLPVITNSLVDTSLYGYIMSYTSVVLCKQWYDSKNVHFRQNTHTVSVHCIVGLQHQLGDCRFEVCTKNNISFNMDTFRLKDIFISNTSSIKKGKLWHMAAILTLHYASRAPEWVKDVCNQLVTNTYDWLTNCYNWLLVYLLRSLEPSQDLAFFCDTSISWCMAVCHSATLHGDETKLVKLTID